jgi:NADH:ubiquinone oxidoreductase subunit C
MTTDDAAQEATGSTQAEETTSADVLAATIWPRVDRALSGITAEAEMGVLDVIVRIPRDEIVRGLRALKNDEDLHFDYLRSLTAIDWEDEGVDVVYHLYSIDKNHNLTVKTRLPVDDLHVDTATTVWRAANWLERETAEMFGVRFTGHPDPRTLLMPEDMDDTFPLRKDHPLAEIEVLQGEGMAYPSEEQE